jgi:hypothetical protein
MNEEDMEPFVFAIVRRRLERKMRKTWKDIVCLTLQSSMFHSSSHFIFTCIHMTNSVNVE